MFFCDISQRLFLWPAPAVIFALCDNPPFKPFTHLHSPKSHQGDPKRKDESVVLGPTSSSLPYKVSLSTIGLSRFRNVCELTTRHLVAETLISMMKSVSFRAPSSFASLTLLEKVELWNWKRAKPFPIFLLCNEVEMNMKYDIKNCCVVNWSLRLFVRPWYFWHKVYTFFFPILRTDKNAEHLQQSQSKRNQRTYWILLTDLLLICTSRTVILTVRLALLGA